MAKPSQLIESPPTGRAMSKSSSLIDAKEEIRKLKIINAALMERVEQSMDQQGSAYSLFQTAINLDGQVKRRTSELTATLTQLENSNVELKNAISNAEQANSSKTRFLAAAGHDVLQPLNAATLLLNTLSSIQTNDEGTRLCDQINRSLENMGTLLRTLLYMSRLDAGDIEPELQSVSLDELFGSLESVFQPIAEQKKLDLRIRKTNLCVHTDPNLLRRILQNIISNAIRYTENGGVLIRAGRVGDRVIIRVADTGIGIEPSEQENVFLEFHRNQQGSNEQDNTSAGLGLGLAIVERMINAMNHELNLSSRPGIGSCFRLVLALSKATQHAPSKSGQSTTHANTDPRAISELTDTRVLLIENDLEVMKAMEALLGRWGCQLRLASSTEEALNTLGQSSWRPDLIVADQHLDGPDLGTSTIDLVRTLAGSNLPSIIITANPSRSLAGQAHAANIEMMLKPVKPGQLRALMSHLIKNNNSEELT